MRIRTKLIAWLVLVALIPTFALQTYVMLELSETVQARAFEGLELQNERDYIAAKNFISDGKNLAVALTQLPPLSGLQRSRETGYDEQGTSTYEQWMTRLETIFTSFVEADSNIYQLRLIDVDGQELVKVVNNQGQITALGDVDLQDKSASTYFSEALWNQPGEVYVSDIELNIEFGQIEKPYVPVIRYAVPVYVEGELDGIIVVNKLVQEFLSTLTLRDPHTIILDQDGYYIYDQNPEKQFAKQLSQSNFFDISKNGIDKDIQRDVIQGVFYNEATKSTVFWHRVYLDQKVKRSIIVAKSISDAEVIGLVRSSQIRMLLITLLLIGLTLLVALIVSSNISKPIKHLVRFVKDFGGDPSILSKNKLKIDDDEIGELSQAFISMGQDIERVHAELEDRVKMRTAELSETQKKLEDKLKETRHLNNINDVQRKRLKLILDNLPVGVFIATAPNGEPEIINKKGMELLNIHEIKNPDSKIGRYTQIYNLVKEDGTPYPEEDLPLAISLKTGSTVKKDDIYINRPDNDTKIPLSVISTAIKDNYDRVQGAIVVFQDITQERQVDQAKTEFVSLASHQLRTPLSAINWFTEMLLSGDAGEINDQQRQYLEEVAFGSQRMVSLVNSLLNVSRLELGTFSVEPEPTDVVALLEDVIHEIKPISNKREHKITEDIDTSLPEISLDPKLMRMVMQNFLSNAVKYTPPGGAITVTLQSVSKDTKKFGQVLSRDSLFYAVTDNGLGIPENQKKKIFQKLFRADNVRATDTEGTGLGLYIIKLIIDHVGGQTWFESTEGQGTTFCATIPISGMETKKGNKQLN